MTSIAFPQRLLSGTRLNLHQVSLSLDDQKWSLAIRVTLLQEHEFCASSLAKIYTSLGGIIFSQTAEELVVAIVTLLFEAL